LRPDFDPKDKAPDVLTWGEFFEKFDEAELSFLYQEKTEAGKVSRFHKFIYSGGKH